MAPNSPGFPGFFTVDPAAGNGYLFGMLRIALTGGIACGKSLVGATLEKQGVAVCDADLLAHELMLPGQAAYREIVGEFGQGILDPDGQINRVKLGGRVFADPLQLARLNAITHPRVAAAWTAWLAGLPAQTPVAVVLIPLLYEAGLESGWDAVVCVSASQDAQETRLLARGLTRDQARRRMASQMPVAEKARRADFVIVNDGTVAKLERQTEEVLARLLESKYGR